MKKIIKLLFPKAYQAIFDDGYNQAYNAHNEDYNNPDYDYDCDYDYDYDYEQYEADMELQRLHDEQYLHEEYYAELAEEYDRECRKAEELLAEIYNPKAPLLYEGDKIHLHSKEGMYTVTEVYNDSFAYRTRDSIDNSYADYSDYKCHAGGRWNKKGV